MYGDLKIYLATIIEVQKSSVKVRYNNIISDFVPYTQVHNTFKTAYSPPTINETALYLKMGHFGIVLGTSILPQEIEDQQEQDTQKIQYADGTIITYSEGVLKIESLKELKIECQQAHINAQQEAKIECQEAKIEAKGSAKIKASSASIDAQDITLGGSMASPTAGVVTGECNCAFTGAPHPMFSSKVKAMK
ncbi:phage baseplate assembly protein V [Helicobacter sp. L8]|uniref:phage baseplate assembly protein V n=1 Tax=Helicobacter sp. L8 TaxID=2316078 RepID=UPI000EB56F37|nr:phage baseplate assembly protein V [Helicobacter sp. L8]